MKKIITLILLLCMIFAFAACTENKSATPENTEQESTTPKITTQEVYDAGKNLEALLGDHENVYIQVMSNGNVIREEYLSKQHYYSFSDAEYMNMGFDYASLSTNHAEYVCFDNNYAFNVMLTPNGMVDTKERFDAKGAVDFISSEVLNDDAASITEKDGSIIVTFNADVDEIILMGEDVVSCEETYILDAKTGEMTATKTVYTYKDGTVEEGVATITRDVEIPEGMKPLLAYEQKNEDMRTVTIVSNPGTDNEKTETVKLPKGLQVALSSDWNVEKTFDMFADAACTQAIAEDPNADSDDTIYIKWNE